MSKRVIRNLNSSDFASVMKLEEEVFGTAGEVVLGPYYIRLCCDFYYDTCFVVEEDGEIVGYALCFIRGREAYCTTLAVIPKKQGSKVAFLLIRSLVGALMERVDSCWFTVKKDNYMARTLHVSLGAHDEEVKENFYGPGDHRIVSRIDRRDFDMLRGRFQRIGLINNSSVRLAGVAA